ncbi:unnamed protein product [Gongylonema pulchrum]|uniref:Kinetochore protein NDC80 n=1 Tax=Gongylonema pulchrum TaxID=637853 RepID=A0A183E589_9BILA|nr:unnamed protein product [Gongylonema pulchrum]
MNLNSVTTGGQRDYALAATRVPPPAIRKSSTYSAPSANCDWKEERKLHERNFQLSLQREVLRFLSYSEYPYVNEKLVKNPTKEEFALMFEFIFQQLAPNYTVRKFEDDMPFYFRLLGYSANLKPSIMRTVGMQQTMPHLLLAIVWLIDLVRVRYFSIF